MIYANIPEIPPQSACRPHGSRKHVSLPGHHHSSFPFSARGKTPERESPNSPTMEVFGVLFPRFSPMAYFEKTAKGTRAHVFIKGVRDSRTFDTKREAQNWSATRELEIRAEAGGKGGTLKTIQDAFKRYGEEVAPVHKGARWEVVRLDKLARDFPRIKLDKLTSTHIQEWRDVRLTEVAPGSVLREMKLLTSVFEQCRKEWRWLAVNPCTDVRKPTAPPHKIRTITRGEIRGILRAFDYPARTLPRHAVAHAFLLALRSGARAGELAGMTWGDVFPNFVRLPKTKNGQSRDVPLSKKARRLLEQMRGFDRVSVFGVSAGSIDTHFRAARARAGLSGFTFHDTRHTAATWIGRSGKLQLLELCKMFGWSDPKMAMIYFNPSADDLASRLD
jgi:integrase